jgi:hypothetical protein
MSPGFQRTAKQECPRMGLNQERVPNKLVSIGDVAHIIAHTERGPRRDELSLIGLSEEEIDSYKNVILLCKNCHRKVDHNPEAYPADLLYRWKQEHEDLICSMRNRKNAICLIHKTKGPPIYLSKALKGLNFTFVGGVSLQEQIDSFSRIDWNWAKTANIKVCDELMTLREDHQDAVVVLLPLSLIPMLIHLGSLLTDTIPVEVLQYSRNEGLWVRNRSGERCSGIQLRCTFDSHKADVLVVTLEITSTIDSRDIKTVLPEQHDCLRMVLPSVGTDKVLHQEDVNHCKKQFRDYVEDSLRRNSYREVHLFYAGPAGLAVEIGRCINANMWPCVWTYHFRVRGTPRYEAAIAI